MSEGLAEVVGAGTRGDPHLWRRPPDESCSGSRPYRDGTGTETEEPEKAVVEGFDSVPGSSPVAGAGTESHGEDTSTPTDSVPVLHIGKGTGTETNLPLIEVPWLGFSSEFGVLWDDLWSRWQERAAVLEFEAGYPRELAERFAWTDVAR